MADKTSRLLQNLAGAYYVDESCIDCDQCRSMAPDIFQRDDAIGFSVVIQQPITPEMIREAEDALQGCPTESIGNDGNI